MSETADRSEPGSTATEPAEKSKADLIRERDASEQLMRRILEAVPGGAVHVSIDGAIRAANAEALRVLGFSYDEVTNRYTQDWEPETMHEDGRTCTVQEYPVSRALMTGEPQPPVTIGVRTPSGGIVWAVFTALPVHDPQSHEVTGAVVTFIDITDRIKLEEARRASQAMLESVLASAPDTILHADLDGTIRFINRSAASRAAGHACTTESQRETSYFDLINPDDHERVRNAVTRMADSQTVVSYEVRGLYGVDDSWYGTRIGPVLGGDAVVGFLAVATDITERKRMEQERQRMEAERQRMEAERATLRAQLDEAQRLESVGRLAGGVAHDFNNLLAVIRGNLDLVKGGATGTSMAAPIAAIGEATERATQMSRQLLALSANEQELDPQRVQLNSIVHGVEDMLARLLGDEVTLVFEPDNNVGSVNVDRMQLERVIINLCINGRDAMPGGGKLLLRTRQLPAESEELGASSQRWVAIDVVDTGTGIDGLTRERMFEPFFTTKKQGHGTGLGLAVVERVVKQSGGNLEVVSVLDEGTRITVQLPCAREVAPRVASPVREREPGGGTILLVEDEPAVRLVTQRILEFSGYQVRVAESGEQALAMSANELGTIDMLITDVVMPSMSGPELAEQLLTRLPELRILFMSGYNEERVQNRGPFSSKAAFVRKPFTADALTSLVQDVLGR